MGILNGGGTMQIQTSRFGLISIAEEDLVQFSEGILGFSNLTTFVFLDDPNDEIFAWLQSCENPAIAFPVLEPELFSDNYNVTLAKSDQQSLQLPDDFNGMRVFTIVTIPNDPTQMTANLKAPVIVNVNKRIARQCVLQDNKLAICEPIFTQLQQRVVQHPQTPIKSNVDDLGIALNLPKLSVAGSEASK